MDQSDNKHLEEKELGYDLEKNIKENNDLEENVKEEEKPVEKTKEYNFDDELNAQLEANYKEILQEEEKKEDSKPVTSEVGVEVEVAPRKKPFWACLPFF